jgi:hypothetical protein
MTYKALSLASLLLAALPWPVGDRAEARQDLQRVRRSENGCYDRNRGMRSRNPFCVQETTPSVPPTPAVRDEPEPLRWGGK